MGWTVNTLSPIFEAIRTFWLCPITEVDGFHGLETRETVCLEKLLFRLRALALQAPWGSVVDAAQYTSGGKLFVGTCGFASFMAMENNTFVRNRGVSLVP